MAENALPGGAQPAASLDRAAEEAGFYHEAGLNATWTGTRLALGGLSFGFGAFVFAFFYLRSLNSYNLWYPAGHFATVPNKALGTVIMVLFVLSAAVQTAALQQIKAGKRGVWLGGAAVALLLGLAAIGLQIVQLATLPFLPGGSGFASVFTGTYPVFIVVTFCAMIWLEILIMRCRAVPEMSFVEQPPTFAEAFAVQRFQASLSGFTVTWNYLAVVAFILWVLFYLVH